MLIDTTSKGFQFYSRSARQTHYEIQWLGTVDINGERGALALHDGRYLMFNGWRRPLELDPMEVLGALQSPTVLNPPGRRAGPHGVNRARTVTLNDLVCEAARIQGDGNLSKGLRLAVEYAAVREDDFKLWCRSK